MQESLNTLFQMQQIDQQLYELERLKLDIPAKIDDLNRAYAEAENRLLEREEYLENLQKNRRQCERDVEASQVQIQKYQGQLLSVKSNKEYDALQHEIQAQKTSVSVHEDTIIELMTEIEVVSEELEQLKAEAERQKERITEDRDALQQQLATVDEDVLVKLDERKRVQMRIEDRILKVYDRIRKGRRRDVVVSVKKGACGGCFHIIPLQQISEIRRMNRLMTCESCGRILVVESDA